MKKILMFLIAMCSFSSALFAQEVTPLGTVVGIFKSVDFNALTTNMAKEGKKNAKFFVGVDGRIYNISDLLDLDEEAVAEIIPFTVHLGDNHKYYFSVALGSVSNLMSNAIDRASQGFGVFYEAKVLVFEVDQGLNMNDINTFQWKFIDVDAKGLALGNSSNKSYIALTAGASIGGKRQQITLPDGSLIDIGARRGAYKTFAVTDDGDVRAQNALAYNLRFGLELAQKLTPKMKIKLSAGYEYIHSNGGIYDLDAERTNNRASSYITNVSRDQFIFKPSAELNIKLGKKKSLDVFSKANLSLKDRVEYHDLNKPTIDLRDRNNNRFNVGIKFNF